MDLRAPLREPRGTVLWNSDAEILKDFLRLVLVQVQEAPLNRCDCRRNQSALDTASQGCGNG